MRHTKLTQSICSILVCSMMFASGTFVFAADYSESTDNMKSATLVKRSPVQTVAIPKHGSFKAVIDKLVEEGKLSKDKADQIDRFIKEKRNKQNQDKKNSGNFHKNGLLKELVDENIITQAEADAIRNRFKEQKEQELNRKLSILVKQGTINQAQADKVLVYYKNSRQEKIELHKKMENMTEEQRKTFLKENKPERFTEKLVKDGVLTQEQANAVRDALKDGHKNNCKKNHNN